MTNVVVGRICIICVTLNRSVDLSVGPKYYCSGGTQVMM